MAPYCVFRRAKKVFKCVCACFEDEGDLLTSLNFSVFFLIFVLGLIGFGLYYIGLVAFFCFI